MRAIALVGGEGTRLRPLTLRAPKQMLPMVGEPMIVRVLEGLARHGIEEVVLSLGYKPDAFVEAFPNGEAAGVRLRYAVERELLDTAGALRFAAAEAGITEAFVAVNGDVLTDLDLSGLIELHRSRGAEATIALTPVPDPSAFGIVVIDAGNKVEEFVEKPPAGAAKGNLANAGTYVIEPSVLAMIASDRRVSIEREIFPALVERGSLYAMASDAYWLDAGTPVKYLEAQLDIVAGLRPGFGLPGVVETGRRVLVSPGAEVAGSLVGPVYVGAGARIEPRARVERSVVSVGAVVGEGSIVTGSALLPGAEVGPGCVIEDSIIGSEAVVGAGSVLKGYTVVGPSEKIAPATELDGARVPSGPPS